MKILSDVILNIILTMFPILIYFIYGCYQSLRKIKYNQIVLGIVLFSSIYLVLSYGSCNDKVLLFCNIPIVVAYLKKKPSLGIILSFIVIIYSKIIFNFPITILIIKYIVYYIIYLISNKRKSSEDKFISAIAILQGFFISFEYFFNNSIQDIEMIFELFVIVFIFYLVPFIILYLFKLGNKITNLYLSISELEKDKQLKNSLFKITHEVKNPIAVCKGYLDMMEPNDIAKTTRYLAIIKQEIDRSLNLMTDFMEFSKIKLNKESLDINMLLDDVHDEMQLFINKNIHLDYKINDDEIYIQADYERLKQVLINLIKNSIESIEKKGKIQLKGYPKKDYFYIEITDNGCGMDKETLNHLTEMFYTTKEKGSGLGTSLSLEIIKGHGGNLQYQSKLGEGTIATIKLPIEN